MGGRWSAAAACAAAAVLLLTGCGGSAAGETAAEASLGFVAGDGSIVLLAPEERTAAPVAAGPLLSGGQLNTADLQGAVVVLNVWASWCAPCRAESPDLQAVWDATREGGVQFVGISTRDSEAAAQAFVANYGLTYPHLLDPDGRTQLLFRDSLPPQAIPSTLVLDKHGRVAGRVLGAASQSQLLGLIEPLVAEPYDGAAPEPIVVQP
jgi:peroxiredoxin